MTHLRQGSNPPFTTPTSFEPAIPRQYSPAFSDDTSSDSEDEVEKLLLSLGRPQRVTSYHYPSIGKGSWLPRLVGILFVYTALDIWRVWSSQVALPVEFGSIARATFYHASMSYDLVESVSLLQDSCAEEQLSSIEMNKLKILISPLDPHLATQLQKAVSATLKLREDLDQPALAVSVHLKSLESSLMYMERLLSTIQSSETRNWKRERTLRFYVDTYLSDEMPSVLRHLSSTLGIALQRCDMVASAKEAVLEGLPALFHHIDPVKPGLIVKDRWEGNFIFAERKRLVEATLQIFQLVDTLRASIQRSQEALLAYQGTPFIFEHVDDMPPLRHITNATMEYFIVRLHETLPELSRITDQVLSRRLM